MNASCGRYFFLLFLGDSLLGMFKFIFGQDTKSRAQRDQYRPTTVGKNMISPINDYGTCFSCEGTGTKTLECRACNATGTHRGQCRKCKGTGHFELPAKPCYTCNGSGKVHGNECRRCNGTGNFKAAVSQLCRKCEGSGDFTATCRKCDGVGTFKVTCKKCEGSGWFKFKRR